jgi:hypothetical protein
MVQGREPFFLSKKSMVYISAFREWEDSKNIEGGNGPPFLKKINNLRIRRP